MVFAAVVSSSLTQFLLLQFYIAIYFIFFLSLTYIRTKPMAYSYVVFNYFLYRLVHNSDLCRTDCMYFCYPAACVVVYCCTHRLFFE